MNKNESEEYKSVSFIDDFEVVERGHRITETEVFSPNTRPFYLYIVVFALSEYILLFVLKKY